MTSESHCDVAVVGSGAGGACVAYALSQAGLKTIVLEKGTWHTDTTHDDDELYYYILRKGWPSLKHEYTVVNLATAAPAGSISNRMGQSYGTVGGGTVFYAGVSERFRLEDFRKRTIYGAVDGADVVDWPDGFYDELEPYYTKAEALIGVSGASANDPLDPPRSKNALLPPLPKHRLNDLLHSGAQRLGWHAFDIPLALSSQYNPVTGRNWCVSSGLCSGYPCAWGAKGSVDRVLLKGLVEAGKLTVVTEAVVRRLEADKGKVSRVIYSQRGSREEHAVQCNAAVLAASGIVSPLLMLASKLGNSNDMVGRNLMLHIEAQRGSLFEGEFRHDQFYNVKKLQVNDHYRPSVADGYINHASMQTGTKQGPIRYSQIKQPGGWGAEYIARLMDEYSRYYELQAMVEDLPQTNNRVTIAPDRLDVDGLPVASVFHRYHPMDARALAATFERMGLWLESSGGTSITSMPAEMLQWLEVGDYTRPVPWRPVGYHPMGTLRMGDDPHTSVVDRNCESHEVRNLYVVDSSIFPSSAGVNPTLTIQANALRVGDRIAARVRGTE